MAQFTCNLCGDNFDVKSRFERHTANSHPKRAPSAAAADIQKALSGIQYPKTREELVDYAAGIVLSIDKEELMNLIRSLQSRLYRDAAEVAMALGEVKRRQ